jgi:hypothetical protein
MTPALFSKTQQFSCHQTHFNFISTTLTLRSSKHQRPLKHLLHMQAAAGAARRAFARF